MAGESPNTLLLIADISGYTRFMKQHAISLSHAKEIVVRLLTRLMHTAKPPLRVAELEGDAVFFYASAELNSISEVASAVGEQIPMMFSAFKDEIGQIDALQTCACDACTNIHQLKLKQVVHIGVAEIERIGQFEKLFGLDVIVVHRLLKNSVPSEEYLLMTPSAFRHLANISTEEPKRFREVFDEVGELETFVVYPENLPASRPPSHDARSGIMQKLQWRFEITLHTAADWLGLRRYSGTFRNIPA